ncbi:unnamed protein product [Lampetra planeri]
MAGGAAGCHGRCTAVSGVERSHWETPVGAFIGAGAEQSRPETVHMRERREAEMPYTFREVLLALGQEAYLHLGEGALDFLVVERLKALVRELKITLPSAASAEISFLTVV